MRVLLLAPHPFYQDRGTPIAVDMLLRVLSENGIRVDVVTFPEGEDRSYDGVNIYRVNAPGRPRNVRPGFSLKKIYLDVFLFFRARKLLRTGTYDLIHAVEESAFMALLFRKCYGIPYIYDMDSMLSEQLVSRLRFLAVFGGLFRSMESAVIRNALAVAPMCDDLAERAAGRGNADIMVVKDVSLINTNAMTDEVEDIRSAFDMGGIMVMYVGNLEPYQGIDLLIDSFRRVQGEFADATLVIIGGTRKHVEYYSGRVAEFALGDSVYLIGPRPVEHIGAYLCQADVLVSPRCEGSNTPMKIYSYLHSGVPVVATNLPTHTQVLNEENALLVQPDADALAAGIVRLAQDASLRRQIGDTARKYAEKQHGLEKFKASVSSLYSGVAGKIRQ